MARSFRSLRLPGTAALALLVFAACGDEDPMDDPAIEPDTAPAVEAAPSPMDTMMQVIITLETMNESSVSGEAMAMHSDDAVVVILELEGLPGAAQYAAHVHAGTCAAVGPVVVPLNPVAGLADGTGTSTTTLEADEIGTDGPHFIMVHGEGGTPLACGDMEGHEGG